MKFIVSQEEKITVSNNGNLFFKADAKNYIKYNLRFYKEDKFILETSSMAFVFFKKIWVKEQYLPYDIEFVKQKGLFGFLLKFNGNLIYIRQRPLRNPVYRLYFNGILMGEVQDYKGISVGRHYTVTTFTEDEILNLYLLITFAIQLIAL
jgi:hypothetical protein